MSRSKSKISQTSLHPPVSQSDDIGGNQLWSNFDAPPHNLDNSPKPSEEFNSSSTHSKPLLKTSSNSNILEIFNVSVHAVPSVVWNDKNSLYVVFRINGMCFKTATQYGVDDEAMWEGNLCYIALQQMLSKNGKDAKITAELYNENLAIKDKLIGQCEFTCNNILDQIMSSPAIELSGELMESQPTTAMNVNKKFRGSIVWNVRLSEGTPSEANWFPNKDFSESVPATARSKIVDISAPYIPEINGISPRTIRATADALQAWENEAPEGITVPKNNDSTNSIPRPKSAVRSQAKARKVSTHLLKGISQARESVEPAVQMLSTSAPNTSRISRISEDNLPMTATTSITGNSGHHEYHHSNSHSIISQPKHRRGDLYRAFPHIATGTGKVPKDRVPAVVEISCFFDKCFTMAFHIVCSTVELSALEIMILLDSLGHSVAVHWIEEAGMISMSASQSSVPFPSVSVPISHPAAFANCICQYVQQYPDILDQSQFFCFTSEHAAIAIKHLIRLLKGPYEEVRDAVFRASNWQKEFAKGKRNGNLTEILSVRPQSYDQESCHRILQLMEMPISIQDSVSNGQVFLRMDTTGNLGSTADAGNTMPLPSSGSFGHRMSSIDSVSAASQQQTLSAVISAKSLIKSSLKRARLSIYQNTLRILDSMWVNGGRPWDKLNDYEEGPKTFSNSKIQLQQGASVSKRRKSTMKKDFKGLHPSGRTSFVIVEAAKLFEAIVPINRAYGVGFSLQDLSQFANTVGGFPCTKELFSAHPQDEMKSDVLYSTSLQWVKVLFPSKEVKHHALQFFQTHMKSNNYHHLNSSFNDFYYLRSHPSAIPTAPTPFESHLGDETLENERHVLSLTDEAMGREIEDEDEVDILVRIPRYCLDSMSIGVNKLLQMSRGSLHIDDVHLGMRVQVVDFPLLQRQCERFEWFDRPSVDTLEKLATRRVEVISLAELQSKGRVGIKLLHDDQLCDALPIEALQLISSTKPNQLLQSELKERKKDEIDANHHEDGDILKKGIRRKSRLHKSHERKDDPTAEFPNHPVTTAALIADVAAVQKQQEKQREEIRELKQSQEELSSTVAAIDKNLPQEHHNTATRRNRMKDETGFKKKNSTITKKTPEDAELAGLDEEEVDRVPTMAVRISSPNQLHSAVRSHSNSYPNVSLHKPNNSSDSSASQSKRPELAGTNRISKISAITPQDKDFSWLKSPQKLVEERQLKEAWPVAANEALSSSIGGQQEHHNAEAKVSINHTNDKSLLHHSKPKTSGNRTTLNGTILHHWNPSFDAESAEYTSGVYIYPPHSIEMDRASIEPHTDIATPHEHFFTTFEMPLPFSPLDTNNNPEIAANHALSSIAAMPRSSFSPRRPASAPAVQRIATKLKERKQKELEDHNQYKKFQETPPSSPPKDRGLGLSGFGYTSDGRKENAVISLTLDQNLFETSELLEKKNKVKQSKKVKPGKDASKTALKKLFGMNERNGTPSNSFDVNNYQKAADTILLHVKQVSANSPKSQKD